MSAFTMTELVECAQREVKQRHKVYARLVERGAMTQVAADRQIAMMLAIAENLEAQAGAERLL
jgi:hypothetical protein